MGLSITKRVKTVRTLEWSTERRASFNDQKLSDWSSSKKKKNISIQHLRTYQMKVNKIVNISL
jgi:hypothetical protein